MFDMPLNICSNKFSTKSSAKKFSVKKVEKNPAKMKCGGKAVQKAMCLHLRSEILSRANVSWDRKSSASWNLRCDLLQRPACLCLRSSSNPGIRKDGDSMFLDVTRLHSLLSAFLRKCWKGIPVFMALSAFYCCQQRSHLNSCLWRRSILLYFRGYF